MVAKKGMVITMDTMRSFNSDGPCDPLEHYMIDAMRGLDKRILTLVKKKKYFVIHAARQSGKTTLLQALAKKISDGGEYYVLYCTLEGLQWIADENVGIPAIINTIKSALTNFSLPNASSFADGVNLNSPRTALNDALTAYCRSLDKPLVVLFDEADCLVGDTMIAFLRQLRGGYSNRNSGVPFVHSLALVGMRDIRDYRNEIRDTSDTLGSGSPFNIAGEPMTLKNFTKEELASLYAQHTEGTGQVFQDDAIDIVWEQTQGQPWLVNETARIIVEEITADAPLTPVTAEIASKAMQMMILRRYPHFDSLMARLREDRVRRIIEQVIVGGDVEDDMDSADYEFTKDLGLIRDDRRCVEPANPIYGEIIIRLLSHSSQRKFELRGEDYPIPRYLKGDAIDIDVLLRDFQSFWRANGEIWEEKYDYKEAAPLLILQAFLQRVVNGGGAVIREVGSGTGRTDLCVFYKDHKYPIELKIRRDTNTYSKGVEQTARYMDKFGCSDGWLVIFDQRKVPSWDERLFVNTETVDSKTVTVFGC